MNNRHMDGRQVENSVEMVPYTHSKFQPDWYIFVHPGIKKLHPESPLAGKTLKVTQGLYSPKWDRANERPYSTLVPVDLNGVTWYVEEEYAIRTLPHTFNLLRRR